ncbi:hypothetical protein AK88_05404 [Plasmodium fragile]|uniref:Schizont-infected cell agglutination extracellular alpha domain-containing protein n=1 Tax=Plasmodium fragile TaxID=5857 RepID=A0A0D9QD27_PLAFR|nr:uncharacterized protein AK88_05404 [Plasmodium fragile]KJP84965.1 hypothetical protein AK88_05404 [Plasmodium fragile]
MQRWFDRNMGRLNDGYVGVLRRDCKVSIGGSRKGENEDTLMEHIRGRIQQEMKDVGQELQQKVQELKNKMHDSAGTKSIMDILEEQVKREKDPSSKTAPDKVSGASGPPPPPPPRRPSTPQDPATSGTGPAGTDTDHTGKCTGRTAVHVAKNAGQGIPGASSTTTLSFVSSPEANKECENKSKDSGPDLRLPPWSTIRNITSVSSIFFPVFEFIGEAHASGPPSPSQEEAGKSVPSSPTQAPSPEPEPEPATTTTTTTTSSSGAAAGSPGPPGPAGKAGESGPSGPGSSGPGSTGHQNPASSSPASPPSATTDQGLGSNNTTGRNDFGLGTDPPKAAGDLGGNYGPGPPQVPHTVHPQNVPSTDGGPASPDLTDTVLTATTPILFFLTSVIVALLGYSLWKALLVCSQKQL